MAFITKDPTSTEPFSYTTTSDEDVTLSFDATPLLVSGGAPTVPLATLARVVDNGPDVPVALADAPTIISGNLIGQRLRNLAAGETYKLRVTFLTSGNRRAMTTYIVVVE